MTRSLEGKASELQSIDLCQTPKCRAGREDLLNFSTFKRAQHRRIILCTTEEDVSKTDACHKHVSETKQWQNKAVFYDSSFMTHHSHFSNIFWFSIISGNKCARVQVTY